MGEATNERPTIEDARASLAEHFGYQNFRAGQERIIQAVLRQVRGLS